MHKFSTPQLIFHGSRDYRIAESEGLGCFNALQEYVNLIIIIIILLHRVDINVNHPIRRGVDSRLVVFPDENHWVIKPENRYVRNRMAKLVSYSVSPDPMTYRSYSRTDLRFFF